MSGSFLIPKLTPHQPAPRCETPAQTGDLGTQLPQGGDDMALSNIPAWAVADLIISQGSDNEYTFEFSETVGDTEQSLDLTGFTAHAQNRGTHADNDIWLDITDITTNADGVLVLTIPAEATTAPAWLRRTTGVWDLYLTNPETTVRAVMGTITISPWVTRHA